MKKIIFGFILFLFVGLSQTFSFSLTNSEFISTTSYSSICNSIVQYTFTDNGNRATFGCGNTTYGKSVILSIPYDTSSFTLDKTFDAGFYDPSIKIYQNGNKMFVAGWVNQYNIYLREYNLQIPYDITSGILSNELNNIPYNGGSFGYSFTSDGIHLIINFSDRHFLYTLGTAFNLSSILDYSTFDFQVGGNSYNVNSVIAPDGMSIFVGYSYGTPAIRQYGLTTAYDLSTAYFIDEIFINKTIYGLNFSDDFSFLFFSNSYGSDIEKWATNDTFGASSLEQVWVGSQNDNADGIDFLFECNADCIINYTIKYNYDDNFEPTSFYTGSLGAFSGSVDLFPGSILNNDDFEFNIYTDYVLDFEFIDINDPENILYFYTSAYYDFIGIVVDLQEDDFIFKKGNWDFLTNGFQIHDLTVSPKGGSIWFHITGPNESGTGTKEILAGPYFDKSYSHDFGYGKDTILQVTRPYHEFVGNYTVYMEYIFNDFKIYPFGTGAINYFITEPELFYTPTDLTDKCNTDSTDSGIIPGVSQFFWCSVSLVSKGISNIDKAYNSLTKLFQSIGNIGNTNQIKQLHEVFINFEFFPSTYASETYVYNKSQDPLAIISTGSFKDIPLLNNIYNLIKYIGLLIILVIGWYFIFNNPKNNG